MVLATMFFMIFGWLVILGIILLSILVLGIVLLVVGIIAKKRNRKKGIEKKYPKICTIVGSVLTVIPLVILGVMLVTYIVDSKNSEYNPDTYDPHKSNSLQDEEYCKGIMTEVIRCLDEEDSEGLKEMFSEYSMELSDLDSQIEETMKIYDGVSENYEEFVYSLGSYNVEYGYYYSKDATIETRTLYTDTGREYYIEIGIRLVAGKPSKEGIMYIRIEDLNDENVTMTKIGKFYW
ncbi:MAG: DUF5104 domain-containing protein [Lachnospiraceae bacterium]|nr:DUF5104 domain-containing protein [Lachnospiraceae bacterium]